MASKFEMYEQTVLSIYGTKGGVGKTCLCANIGGLAADYGWRVLMIDTDPQASLSRYYPISRLSKHGVTKVFSHAEISRSISSTAIPGLDIVVADDPDNNNETILPSLTDGHNRLRYALDNLDGYDLVIVDTQGASSKILEPVILSSDILLCPIVPDILSAREFINGTLQAWNQVIQSQRAILRPSLHGVIYRTRATIDSKSITHQLHKLSLRIPSLNFLSTKVPDRTVYRDAATAQVPVHQFERKRKNGFSANDTMTALVMELWPKLKTNLNKTTRGLQHAETTNIRTH